MEARQHVPLVEEYLEFCESLDPSEVNEAWKGAKEIEHTGEYSGKTIDELKAMKAKLKAKEEHTAEETKKLRQINFAIMAKRRFKGDTK